MAGSFGDAIPAGEHAAIRSVDACLTSSHRAVSGEKHRTRLHVLHITTADELALFDAAPTLEALRQKTITTEACVHHLFLIMTIMKCWGISSNVIHP